MATKTCKLPDCDATHHGLGYCRPHYAWFRRCGDPYGPPPPPPPPVCIIDGCEEPQRTLSMCSPHYNHDFRERKKAEKAKTELADMECIAMTCTDNKFKAKLCEPHYRYWRSENMPADVHECMAKYDRLIHSANPTKASLGSPHLYPAPKGEMHVAWPVSVTAGRPLDDRVLNGLTALAMTWFETPPARVGFQLTISRRGPLLLARATERKTDAHA